MQNRIKQNKKNFLIILTISFFAVASVGAYLLTSNDWFKKNILKQDVTTNEVQITNRPVNDVDYSGPSQEDVDSSQNGKKNTDTSPKPESTKNVAVSFADTYNNNVEIRAFIPDFIESDGKCTATLTQGDLVVKKSSNAFIDTSSSQCNPIYIPLTDFPTKGIWLLTVSYDSTSRNAISESIEVKL